MCNDQIKTWFAAYLLKPIMRTVSPWLMMTGVLMAVSLSGCGDNPRGTAGNGGNTGPIVDYTGPAPASPDVQSFRIEFWEPLRASNRCGTCHNTDQTPLFVNGADINVAYDYAKSVVDVSNPGNSFIVAKVGQGHNCWLGDNQACADIMEGYITNWLGSTDGSGRKIQLTAPVSLVDPGDSKSFPLTAQENSPNSFASTVYPLLRDNCAGCHAATQAPLFASADVNAAYQAAKAKINLDAPENSRFVLRLRTEFHNCWSDSCAADATEMQAAIAAFSGAIPVTQIDPSLITSKAMTLGGAIVASGGSRSEDNMIALWEFKTGTGITAFDTSTVSPQIDLTLTGAVEWVNGYGVKFTGGKAQGDTATSKKLRDRIIQTGEYSIEAWVVPADVTQEGKSIISYSAGNPARNFTMAQTMYNYDFLNFTTRADGTVNSSLSTDPDDEDLQATTQHVVMNFDPVNGRQIFVNGVSTGDADAAAVLGGSISVWADNFPLVLGNEQGGLEATSWKGTLRLVAIHNRILSAAEIRQNYSVGVGQKYLMLFSISDRIGIPDSYIMFEVEQFDNYAYSFSAPKFINLSSSWTPSTAIVIKGLRIGVNGQEALAGQAFANMSVSINSTDYSTADGQVLSTLGTIIALDKGSDTDQFFLTFEQLGSATNPFVEATPVAPIPGADAVMVSDIGVRTFDEINATMSAVTGVPVTNAAVAATFTSYRRQLPAVENIQAYLSSHQMAVAQLAMKYCDVLVETNPGYFAPFSFAALPSVAFDTAGRNNVLNPLLRSIFNVDLVASAKSLKTQPVEAEMRNMLASDSPQDLDAVLTGDSFNSLIDCMTRCERNLNECPIYVNTNAGDTMACTGNELLNNTTTRTKQVVKATCAATLGSAVMLIQ